MIEMAEIVAGWPVVASTAATAAAQWLREGRRRSALNRALHELRRPLQAVALASGPQLAAPGGEDPIELAAAALERLDREINGGSPAAPWGVVDGHSLLRAAVGRWQARARLADGSLELRWNAGRQASVHGDPNALAQALDNLIVNAIEHGGSEILVEVRARAGRLRVSVVDRGRESRPEAPRDGSGELIARLTGRRRRGHGLRVVRRVAAGHGGDFRLRCSELETEAVLELPLSGDRVSDAA
jgi:signal transduction histidine kinase